MKMQSKLSLGSLKLLASETVNRQEKNLHELEKENVY